MIVTGEPVEWFVSARLGISVVPPYTSMGIERDGQIVAGVIFHCFEGAAVHITAAGKGWTRGFLWAVGHYVFQQLKCERITFTTEQPEVVALAKRLGAQEEGILRNQFGKGRNGIVLGVLRDEWRYGAPGRTRTYNIPE